MRTYDSNGNPRRRGSLWWDKDKDGVTRLHGAGLVVTDESCTNCRKMFRMKIDFNVSGNHILVCPHCGHKHCRTVTDGKVTGHRWDTRNEEDDIPPKDSMWSDRTIGAKTSAAHQHIRERWLGRE